MDSWTAVESCHWRGLQTSYECSATWPSLKHHQVTLTCTCGSANTQDRNSIGPALAERHWPSTDRDMAPMLDQGVELLLDHLLQLSATSVCWWLSMKVCPLTSVTRSLHSHQCHGHSTHIDQYPCHSTHISDLVTPLTSVSLSLHSHQCPGHSTPIDQCPCHSTHTSVPVTPLTPVSRSFHSHQCPGHSTHISVPVTPLTPMSRSLHSHWSVYLSLQSHQCPGYSTHTSVPVIPLTSVSRWLHSR